tara:strand:- start:215 stop:355 length:141 start_codon:yes stop_codon:yes gene_type:complete
VAAVVVTPARHQVKMEDLAAVELVAVDLHLHVLRDQWQVEKEIILL